MEEFKPTKKICHCCRGDLPLEDFYQLKRGLFGVMGDCKVCHSFKNNNYTRKKKGLQLLSLEEYRSYKKLTKGTRIERERELRNLAHRIEYLLNQKALKCQDNNT